MDQLLARDGRVGQDPALLAFVKCHLTSFLRWDLLRLLSSYDARWTESAELAGILHKPEATLEALLKELQAEGLLEARLSADGLAAYRMNPEEPSTRVVERLVAAATRSEELRRIIIARVLGGQSPLESESSLQPPRPEPARP